MRVSRLLPAAAIAAALVVLPTVPATAAPAVSRGVFDGIGNAYAIENYRLAFLPPTEADLLRYNPRATPEQIRASIDSATDRLDEQRVKASVARYGATPGLNTSDAELKADIAAQKAGFRYPFTKARTALKYAGTAASALTTYAIGTAIGQGALQAFGIDGAGDVCTSDFSSLGPLIGAGDCGDWLASNPATPNDDAVAGTTAGPVTLPSGATVTYTGTYQYQGKTLWTYQVTGATGARLFDIPLYVETPAGRKIATTYPAFKAGTNDASPYSLDPAWAAYADSDQGNGTGNLYKVLGMCDPTTMCASGKPDYLAATATADPARQLQCSIRGSDGNDYTKSTGDFHEGDEQLPTPQCPQLPQGVTPKHVKIIETGGPKPLVIYEGDQDPWAAEVAQRFPQCVEGTCALELYLMPDHASCFDGKTGCNGWYEDTQKTAKYQCEYDGVVVTLEHCNRYRQVFDTAARTAGAPYSSPDGTVRLKASTPSETGRTLKQEPSIESCVKSSTSTGVFSVIFNPVRCAFVWAFVPRPTVLLKATSDLYDDIADTDAGRFVLGWAAFFGRVNFIPGCKGFVLHFQGKDIYPANACPGTWAAPIAALVNPAMTLALLFAAAAAILTSIAGIFGFTPFSGRGDDGGGS